MNIGIEHDGEVCILRLSGQFHSGANLEYMRSKAEQIKALNARRMLADFREVIAMGSSGIGFIVSLYTSVVKNPGGVFMMAGANPRTREVFKLTSLDTVIPSAPDVESALAALKK